MRLVSFVLLLNFFLNTQLGFAVDLTQHHFIQDCNILTNKGELVKVFPGKLCLFLDDGSFVSVHENGIRRYDKKNEILWDVEGNFHHQINLSHDKKRILAIGSKVESIAKKLIRIDTISIIDLNGRVLNEIGAEKLLEWTNQSSSDFPVPHWESDTRAKIEMTHLNSIHEVPKLSSARNDLPFSEGDYIVNGLAHGLFVLSPDLKRIRLHKIITSSTIHRVHDAQVLASGRILFFNNMVSDSTDFNRYSAIQEFDPVTERIASIFEANPAAMFYSRVCGSVQALDEDTIMFSDRLNAAYIYSLKKKVIIQAVRGTHDRGETLVRNCSTRMAKIKQFLLHR